MTLTVSTTAQPSDDIIPETNGIDHAGASEISSPHQNWLCDHPLRLGAVWPGGPGPRENREILAQCLQKRRLLSTNR
jgi:hypothetical protein